MLRTNKWPKLQSNCFIAYVASEWPNAAHIERTGITKLYVGLHRKWYQNIGSDEII